MESKIVQSSREGRSRRSFAKQTESQAKCLKRNNPISQDSEQYQTIRKVRILNNNTDNDKTVFPFSNQQGFQASCTIPIEEEVKSNQPSKKSKEISEIPLKVKFAHFIPEHLSAQYTLQQKALLNIQQYLDSYLCFLKLNRGKKKGAFFKQIRANLIEGKNIFLELTHVKQILFLMPTFYVYERGLDADHCYDILLDLPPNADIIMRKDQFKRKLHQYLQNNEKAQENPAIPMFVFPFQQKIQTQQKLKGQNIVNKIKVPKPTAQTKKSSLMDSLFKNPNDFKQKLIKNIRDEEQKLKKQQLQDSEALAAYDRRDLLNLIDCIHKIYMCSEGSNLPYPNLIKKLDIQLKLPTVTMIKFFQKIVELVPMYLTIVQAKIGRIVQCNKRNYRNARDQIQLEVK